MQIIVPLLALPWLARMLGPDAFGLLMYMCLFPPLIALFVDWGIALGGCRMATSLRGQNKELGELLGAALAGKLLLSAICIFFCLILACFLPHCSEYFGAFMLAIWAGLARGFYPAWFFQGAGYGIARMAVLDVSASICSLAGVVLLIRQPAQWPLYLLLLALTKTIAYGWIYGELWLKYRYRLNFNAGKVILGQTAMLFGTAFGQMLCYNGSQLVLGWFLPASAMGILVAVAKMLRALVSLVNPFTQTLFPEICIWKKENPQQARKALRISLIATAVCSGLASVLAAIAAPWLIAIALGSDFAAAAPVLQLMLLAAPLMACNNVLAQQILVPYGEEKSQLKALILTVVAALPLTCALGHNFGLAGGAILPACLEFLICFGYVTAIWRKCKQALF